jgi:hypothetical protein
MKSPNLTGRSVGSLLPCADSDSRGESSAGVNEKPAVSGALVGPKLLSRVARSSRLVPVRLPALARRCGRGLIKSNLQRNTMLDVCVASQYRP